MSASAAAGSLSEDLASLDPETLSFILADWQLWARDDQLPPDATPTGDDWRVWLNLGGRGAGKTRSGAEWVRAKALGISPLGDEPATRIALVGETLADVRRVMIEGVSGLLAIHGEDERPELEVSKSQLVWPSSIRPSKPGPSPSMPTRARSRPSCAARRASAASSRARSSGPSTASPSRAAMWETCCARWR